MFAHNEGLGPDDPAAGPARGPRGGRGPRGEGRGPRGEGRGHRGGGRGFGRPGGWQQADLPPADDAVAWFTGRLPSDWF
ncbi:MAG: hypothetical protein QOE71_2358, partial [Pseudonocardiales bacterium]|nr:hypothetical protein [Pseudonocardiales bacterium]